MNCQCQRDMSYVGYGTVTKSDLYICEHCLIDVTVKHNAPIIDAEPSEKP